MRGADQANASSREGSRTSSDLVRCCCMSAAPLNRAREKRVAITRRQGLTGEYCQVQVPSSRVWNFKPCEAFSNDTAA